MLIFEAAVAFQVSLCEVGKSQIVEQKLEELFRGKLKDEIVSTFTGIGCVTRSTPTATTAFGAFDPVSGNIFLVARVDDAADATGPVAEYRL